MIKIFRRYFRSRWERFYLKNTWRLILDLSLIMVIVIMAAALFSLYFYRPNLPGMGSLTPPPLDLNNPPLEIEFRLSDNVWEKGKPVQAQLTVNNNSKALANNVILHFFGDNDFSLKNLELITENGAGNVNLKLDGGKIIISQIKPYTAQELNFLVYFNVKNQRARNLTWRAEVEYSLAGQNLRSNVELEPLLVAADLNFSAAAYYTSPLGDQLGVGPIPPLVGIPTKYWIFWEVSSDADFNNLVLSARLPQGVELSEQRSVLSGEFLYNEALRQVLWRLPSLRSGGDSDRLRFEVQLVPTLNQVGQILPLISEGRYYAQDQHTGREISGTFSGLTTNLDKDRFNSGQGRVLEP